MASFVSRRQFTIEWAHCDPAGIVFNNRFFEFFDWGTRTLFEAALGVRPPDMAGAFGILGIPPVDASARFLAPAWFGDVVELASQVSEFRGRASMSSTGFLYTVSSRSRAARAACGRPVTRPIRA